MTPGWADQFGRRLAAVERGSEPGRAWVPFRINTTKQRESARRGGQKGAITKRAKGLLK